MKKEQLASNVEKVLNCPVQDSSGLNDFQKASEQTMIPIQRVGIEAFRLPVTLEYPDGDTMGHDATADMAISLEGGKTGVNMSRFCSILQDEAGKAPLCPEMIQRVLERFRHELRDYEHEGPIAESFLTIKLNCPLRQRSLRSENWGWQYYPVEYDARYSEGKCSLTLQVKYEYSSTCPCSLSLARQYEQDYREEKTQSGHGVATPHGQRSVATVRVSLGQDSLGVNELVELLREALPTETQSLVKRMDEQAFTILNGSYPLFVEDAARRISLVLDEEPRILDWQAKVEHLESLHSHNAVATISKR